MTALDGIACRSQSLVDVKPNVYDLDMMWQGSSLCGPRSHSLSQTSTHDALHDRLHSNVHDTTNSTSSAQSPLTYPSSSVLPTPSSLPYTIFRARMDPVYGQPTGVSMGNWQSWKTEPSVGTIDDTKIQVPSFVDSHYSTYAALSTSFDTFLDAGIPMSSGMMWAQPDFPRQIAQLGQITAITPRVDDVPLLSSFSSTVHTDNDSGFYGGVNTTDYAEYPVGAHIQSNPAMAAPLVVAGDGFMPGMTTATAADRAVAYTTAHAQSVVYSGRVPGEQLDNGIQPRGGTQYVSQIGGQYQPLFVPNCDTFVDTPANLDPRGMKTVAKTASVYPDIAHPRPQLSYSKPPVWVNMTIPIRSPVDEAEGNGVDDITHRRSELRKKYDRILLEERANGKSYAEIIEKHNLPGENATWRGRHRHLKKPPHERRRKVQWTEYDTGLLRTAVCASSQSLSHLQGDLTGIIQQQVNEGIDIEKLGIDWAQVTSRLQQLGCSYKFSVIACKKEFKRILGYQSAPRP